jgi:phosphatidylglycerol lysyltransferase
LRAPDHARYDHRVSAAPAAPVRDLVLRYGWNTTSYQILNPGIEHWLGSTAPAVVGFVRQPRRWIVAGAPICEGTQIPAVVRQFEESAHEQGSRVCYFAAMDRLRGALEHAPETHATIAIGAQPVWDPAAWPDVVRRRSSLRAQLNRARNKGLRVTVLPQPQSADLAPLRDCLDQWLASRPFPPMHFLVEPDTLAGPLADRRLYVATRDDGHPTPSIVGFLLASPVPLRQGYLFEQIVRCPTAPNGTAELMIDTAMRDLAARGCGYVTQGLVALSQQARDAMNDNPLWLRALFAWARAHGNRFYNFRGLESFREKMQPQAWETIYAITNEPRFTPRTLYATARAFCQTSPLAAATRAIARAIRQESRWLLVR